jgi:lipopolysaccharide biosynthesis glycosyltransferase
LLSIVMSSDDRLAMPLAVAAHSAVKNLKGRPANLFILDGGMSEVSKRRIAKTIPADQVHIHWIQPVSGRLNEIFEKRRRYARYPLAAYYRLLLPEILPREIKKVIYLDVDVIVLADLATLWRIDVEPYQFLAVQEPDGPYVLECFREYNPQLLAQLNLAEFGLRPDHKYCNTGVMVINIEKWRRDQVMDKALDFTDKYFPAYADQDVLNVVLAGQWEALDPRWNVTTAFYVPLRNSPYSPQIIDQVLQDPFIVHFTTAAKPWGNGPAPCKHHGAAAFFEYAAGTDWATTIRWQRRLRTVSRKVLFGEQTALRMVKKACPPVVKRLIRSVAGAAPVRTE